MRRLLMTVSFVLMLSPNVWAQTVSKIVDNGADGDRLVLAILGDGYAQADQQKFRDDVDGLIVNGLFGDPFYAAHRRAFNVYRVELVSKDSGMSTPSKAKDTALDIVYTGTWEKHWLIRGDETVKLIADATRNVAYDFVLIIANEAEQGGVARGNELMMTTRSWATAAHEYGHGIGGLYDEYWRTGTSTSSKVNRQNCSNTLDRKKVIWASHVDSSTAVPTKEADATPATVGMFKGCKTFESGIYRPVINCRMRTNAQPFDHVCSQLMKRAIDPHMPAESADNGAQPESNDETHLRLVVRVSRAGAFDIVQATEVPGAVKPRTLRTSDFLYELQSGDVTLATEALSADPFEERVYTEDDANAVHSDATIKWTTLIVHVPNESVEDLLRRDVQLQIYELAADDPVERITPATVGWLKSNRLMKLRARMSSANFRSELRAAAANQR